MEEKPSSDKKDNEYWKRVASKLAITLAIVILASGLAGSWMSSEKMALDGYKNSNEHLRNLNAIAVKKMGEQKKELDECKEKIKKLEQEIISLKFENADLKTRLDE